MSYYCCQTVAKAQASLHSPGIQDCQVPVVDIGIYSHSSRCSNRQVEDQLQNHSWMGPLTRGCWKCKENLVKNGKPFYKTGKF